MSRIALALAAAMGILLGTAAPSIVHADNRSEAARHFQRAEKAEKDGRYREAIAQYKKAYELSPRPEFALSLARWAEVEGNYGAAASALENYLDLAPDGSHAEGYRRLLRFYRHVGRQPANDIDPRVNRVQLNFDLKPGDEIPYVAVSVNGSEPAYVLLDTGAERNVIDLEYARSIGVGPILPGGRLRGPTLPARWALATVARGRGRVRPSPKRARAQRGRAGLGVVFRANEA